MRFQVCVWLVLSLVLGETALGQLCFRGRPLPECKTFWITESGAFYRFDGREGKRWSERDEYENLYYTWEVGVMVNRNPKTAIGGTYFIGWDGYLDDTRVGFKGRFRWWMRPTTALDFSPGILWSDKIGNAPIWCLSASLNGQDRIMVIGQVEMVRWKKTRPQNVGYFGQGTDLFWYGGLRFGSEMGVVVGILIPIIIAATAMHGMGGGPYWGDF